MNTNQPVRDNFKDIQVLIIYTKSPQYSTAVNYNRWCSCDAKERTKFDEMKFHNVLGEVQAEEKWEICDKVGDE